MPHATVHGSTTCPSPAPSKPIQLTPRIRRGTFAQMASLDNAKPQFHQGSHLCLSETTSARTERPFRPICSSEMGLTASAGPTPCSVSDRKPLGGHGCTNCGASRQLGLCFRLRARDGRRCYKYPRCEGKPGEGMGGGGRRWHRGNEPRSYNSQPTHRTSAPLIGRRHPWSARHCWCRS